MRNKYQQIQAHKESCDIQSILTRYANGDLTALSKTQGIYGDFTNVPTNLNELQTRVIDAERLFYTLPLEVREACEHNPSVFYNMIGTEAFNKLMAPDKSEDNPLTQAGGADSVITEVVNNESKSE